MIVKFEDIFVVAESLECNSEDRRGLLALHRAMSDWPDDFEIVEDFLLSVESYLGEALGSNCVRSKLRTLDVSIDAWRCESLSELLIFLDEFECASAAECNSLIKKF